MNNLERKVNKIKKNRDIYEEQSEDEQYIPPKKVTRFQTNDISSMSVDEIMQSALARRDHKKSAQKQYLRNASPPTHENVPHDYDYTPQKYFEEESPEREYEPEPIPQRAPVPQSQNSNAIIEKKVEEVLK